MSTFSLKDPETVSILQPETVSSGSLPANFDSADLEFFEHDLKRTIPQTQLLKFRDVRVSPEGLLFQRLRLLPQSLAFALLRSPQPQGLAFALAHFRQETSLPILLDHLDATPLEWKPIYLEAIGAFWRYPKGRAAILEQFDRWSSPEERYLNSQAAPVSGLLKYEPDIVLDQFNKSFSDGYVTTTARERMAKELANLLYRKYQNESLLLETFKLLLCDKHVPARERADQN